MSGQGLGQGLKQLGNGCMGCGCLLMLAGLAIGGLLLLATAV